MDEAVAGYRVSAERAGQGLVLGSRPAELDPHARVVHALEGSSGEAVFEARGARAGEGHDGRGTGLQDHGGRGRGGAEDDGVGVGSEREEARHRLVDERVVQDFFRCIHTFFYFC